ncbi:NAD(P)/FAD-dependent oxidoreductase [Gracilibacillus thailandensis]|uniref:Ferredoxin--NADP reductase n=1 Tax=Gracilibacillus thailandensis TaxID=563735 RepID=A0A6N7R540_9BACI|nr:NAD(P)/FAD-dependent oxidoreductase [Gracilibacillus thailandensis]MRI68260.1 NAD(P)-binding protein [Gracilibacillus thailandensis]
MGDDELFDITIIGGGTTGLFATYYATMRNMKVKLLESQSQFGGKVMQFFPEKLIYDVGGYPDISGEDLVKQMIAQANRHQPEMLSNRWVESIEQKSDHFILNTSDGEQHFTKVVLLATGSGTFHTKMPDNWDALPFPEFRKQVATNLMNREKYHHKNVVITATNKVGVGWALYLKDHAQSVTVVNPDSKFHQVKEEDVEQLRNSSIPIHMESHITNIDVKENQLQSVEINETITVETDALLTYHGLELQATPLDNWGVATYKGRILVKGDMATNIPGIFAAGDIVQYEGKTNLIASGYSEAITAVNKAHLFIDPRATEQLYSTVIYR